MVSGDRGDDVVFRYPPPPPPEAVKDASEDLNSAQMSKGDRAISGETAPQTLLQELPFFDIPVKDLANIFCPKQALHRDILDVVLRGHRFVSFPIPLSTKSRFETTFFQQHCKNNSKLH